MTSSQWWNVTKYVHSHAVLKCNFEVFVLLHLSIFILCNLLLLLHYILEANIVFFLVHNSQILIQNINQLINSDL